MINFFNNCTRLFTIFRVFGRYRLDLLLGQVNRQPGLRLLLWANPWRWFAKVPNSPAVALRLAFEDLGPLFVKFGQNLSTRRDILPDEIAIELARLQDHVPPFPGTQAQQIIETAFGQTISSLFAEFDETALASASIAQVHAAKLHDGQEVVVKVLRPDIRHIILQDIDLLHIVGRLIEKLRPRLHATKLIAEFQETILDELDLGREAANASQLRRHFEDEQECLVPKVYWHYVHQNAIVMERVHGVMISDLSTLKKHEVDLKLLAERGVEIFFTQVFRDSFFHADMHPGNIFIDITDPKNPKYQVVDFGIMGALSASDQRYLAENFVAFFNRDYRKVAMLHVESGWVQPETRVDKFESAIRAVCEPLFELPMRDVSIGQVLLQLFQTASRFKMPVQPQLMLLQKTLLNIEGLGRQLYPDLDLWRTAKPLLEDWLKRQIGTRALLRKIRESGPYWMEKLPELPEMTYQILKRLNEKTPLAPTSQVPRQDPQRHFAKGAGAAFVVSGAVLCLLAERYSPPLASSFVIAQCFFLFTGIGLLLGSRG